MAFSYEDSGGLILDPWIFFLKNRLFYKIGSILIIVCVYSSSPVFLIILWSYPVNP